MKYFILALTLVLGSTSVNAKKAPLHADPYKIMTSGIILHSDRSKSSGRFYFAIAYKGVIYECKMDDKRGGRYYCRAFKPETE